MHTYIGSSRYNCKKTDPQRVFKLQKPYLPIDEHFFTVVVDRTLSG